MTPPQYLDHPYYDWPAWEALVAKWLRWHCSNLPRDTVIHARVASAGTRAAVGDVIAAFAAEHGDNGIVLVRRSHLESGRAPILRAVFERTPCPVLLVAGPARAQPQPQTGAPMALAASAPGHG
jgi:hypothetical protein